MKTDKNISIFSDDEVVTAIHQIVQRSDKANDLQQILDSFYDINLIKKLDNINNQTIQGRRGTGKTHVLRALSCTLERNGEHAIYLDCNQLGDSSTTPIANTDIEKLTDLSVSLFRDFIHGIAVDLNNYLSWNNFEYVCAEDYNLVRKELDEIFLACQEKAIFQTEESQEFEIEQAQNSNSKRYIRVDASPMIDVAVESGKTKGANNRLKLFRKSKQTDIIIFPNISQNLINITHQINTRLYILVDEWASIPLILQPIFAEFLKKCLMCCPFITVKIAVVPLKTKFIQKIENQTIGIEPGAEISCAINLDQMFVVDQDYKRVTGFMTELLIRHVNTRLKNRKIKREELDSGFENAKIIFQIIRASEGNARDFINILIACIDRLDYRSPSEKRITFNDVIQASHYWFNNDKYSHLSEAQIKHFGALFSYIVSTYQTRGAFIQESTLANPYISDLIDARVIHVVSQGHVSDYINPKERLALIILDYGAYAEQLEQGRCLDLFDDDVLENICRHPRCVKTPRYAWWPYDRRRVVGCFMDIFEDDVFKPIFSPNLL